MAGVFIVTQNGSIVEQATIDAAFASSRLGSVMLVTTNQTLGDDAVLPVGSELRITNNAVITLGAWNLTINGEFQKPNYDCFDTTGGGTLTLPTAGPGALQDWSCKNLTAGGDATVGGTFDVTGNSTMTGTLGVTGAITATGGVTGNLTGTASNATLATTATTAVNASGTGTAVIGAAGVRIDYGSCTTGVFKAFSTAFSSPPAVVLTPGGALGLSVGWTVDSVGTTGFVPRCSAGSITFYYVAVGPA